MSNRFPPMPPVVGDVEEDTRAVAHPQDDITANHSEQKVAIPQTSIQTKTVIETHYITWTIDGRSLEIARLAEKGDKRGVIEACVEKCGHEFKLELCASGWRNSQDGYCAFYLTLKGEGESFVARYRVHTGDITRTSSIRHDFHLGVGFPNFCEQTTFDSVGAEQSVKLVVTVEEFKRQSQTESARKHKPVPGRLETLACVLQCLHANQLHTDVTIVCDGHRIPAHKSILSSCSPVWQSMLQQRHFETADELTIEDFSYQTVSSAIHFVYTAKLDTCFNEEQTLVEKSDEKSGDLSMDFDDEENLRASNRSKNNKGRNGSGEMNGDDDDAKIMNLFRLAERYEIMSLVVACCRNMHASLSLENACAFLIRLSPYSCVSEIQDIQDSVYEFARENYQKIKETDGFRNLFACHPVVVLQFLDKLVVED